VTVDIGDIIVSSSQVGGGSDEVNVEVGVIILERKLAWSNMNTLLQLTFSKSQGFKR
jgi:hypothetical protein